MSKWLQEHLTTYLYRLLLSWSSASASSSSSSSSSSWWPPAITVGSGSWITGSAMGACWGGCVVTGGLTTRMLSQSVNDVATRRLVCSRRTPTCFRARLFHSDRPKSSTTQSISARPSHELTPQVTTDWIKPTCNLSTFTSAKQVTCMFSRRLFVCLFVCLSVCLSVCLLATSHKKLLIGYTRKFYLRCSCVPPWTRYGNWINFESDSPLDPDLGISKGLCKIVRSGVARVWKIDRIFMKTLSFISWSNLTWRRPALSECSCLLIYLFVAGHKLDDRYFQLASCLIYAWALPVHLLSVAISTEIGSDQSAVRSWRGSDLTADWLLPISLLVWVRSFIEPDVFDNYVPFDNTPNLLWKLWFGLGLDHGVKLRVALF